MICAACGATADEDARFCASCGRPLRTVDDERRVVTVLFADLVGFTALSERLDPERVKNLVDRCFDRLAADVTAFGGQVDKIVGDALVALFGAPTAHEDDAERAVRAALRMHQTLLDEVADIGEALEIRIGVNTGEVVVGAMRAAGSVTAMGDVVNTASRLQTSAAPGEVLVGPATHAATHRTIGYESRGPLAAKGREQPIETWLAVAPTLPPGHRIRRNGVPLIGREHELGLLRHAAHASITNQRALLVLLVGDVGMGKSRLVDEVGRATSRALDTVLREGRCLPYGEANVWWPVADAMAGGLGVAESDGIDTARAAVTVHVASVLGRAGTAPEVGRVTEGLLTLLGYDPPVGADPATVRQEAGRSVGVYADALAAHRPLVLQLSDLHWADDAVLELVDDVFATVHHRPVVVLATARPSLLDRWTPRPGRHNTLVLHLDPLRRDAAAELLESLVGEVLPDDVAAAVLDRSGGNPFFLEELVGLLGSPGDDERPGRVAALPDTLRGLVAARLDDLGPAARSILQAAAVLGQRGPLDALREMSAHTGRADDLVAGLAELGDAEILTVEGDHWSFRSDLVRQVAYQTITKTDRAAGHLGIARFLDAKASSGEHRPMWLVDQLAHHYAAAVTLAAELGPHGRSAAGGVDPDELNDRARHWLVEAAERARRDQALPTAARLYGQALGVVALTDAVAPADVAELHLARADVAIEAWDLTGAAESVEAATALIDAVAHPVAAARALVLRGRIDARSGNPDAAVAVLTAAIDRYGDLGDGVGRADALRQRGMVELFAGRLAEAEASASDALAGFVSVGDRSGRGWALQNLAWIAFVTGRTDDADRFVQEAVDVFSDLVDTRGMTWSLGLLAWIRFQQRRVVEASALGERMLDEARSRNDPWATAMMTLLVASIRLWSGGAAEAVELAQQARRGFHDLGDAYGDGLSAAILGRSLVMTGRTEEGFALLSEATATPGPAGDLGGRPGQMARFARLAAALQVGEPDRAIDVEDELRSLHHVGGDDPAVALALAALQRGRADEAGVLLASTAAEHEPNLVAVRALHAAATGAGDAGALADLGADLGGATYLDRAIGESAAALEALAQRRFADAVARVEVARAAVAETDDRAAAMVVALVAAEIAAGTAAPDLHRARTDAEQAAEALGVTPTGWRTVIELAARAVPTG